MALLLADYLKLNGWGSELLRAGEIDPQQGFSGISLLSDVDLRNSVPSDRLVIFGPAFFRDQQWRQQLQQLKHAGVAAVAYIEGHHPPEVTAALSQACAGLKLPLLALPAHTYAPGLLLQASELFAVEENGRAITIDGTMRALRQAVHSDKIHGLQRALHACLDCQVIISIKHDVFAYPPLADFEETQVDPRFWKQLPQPAYFPWIESYYVPRSDAYLIRCQIMYDGEPLGTLSLSGRKRPFDEKELKIADYAAVLCAGMNPTFFKSKRIQQFLDDAYSGKDCDDEDVALLPESGYALVLRESPATRGSRSAKQEEEDSFLGYLIHTTFGRNTFYAFLDNGILVLYCSTSDISGYTRDLMSLLRQNRRTYSAGVSERHSRQRVKAAFAEARHAASVGQFLDDSRDVFFFHELGIYRFFNYPEDNWSINQMLDELMQKLDQTFDPEKKLVLVSTLSSLVKNKYNYSKTAEEMFTHPNTIRYRVGLLEDVWSKDLSKDEDRLLFNIIGKLLPIWQRQSGKS